MVRKLQPRLCFKSVEGNFYRDPVRRLGKLATISADARFIFSICDAGGTNEDHSGDEVPSAAVYNLHGQILSSHKFPSLVNCGMLSANGSAAVAGTDQGRLHLWNAQSGRIHASSKEALNSICDVAISPAGHTVVSTSFRDDAVRIWDSTTMRESQNFPCVFEKRARSGLCALQADAQRVFVCDHREIHVLDLKMHHKAFSVGNCRMNSLGGLGTFMSACDSDRDGRRVVAVHWPRNQLCIWDMRMRKIQDVIRLRGNHGTGTVSITPDGSRVVCSAYPPEENFRLTAICDVQRAKITHHLNHSDARTLSTSISADGTTAISLSKDGVTRVFNVPAQQTLVKRDIDVEPPKPLLMSG